MRLWIKDPLAILADGAERGIVVEGTRIVELVARGADAGRAGRRDLRRLAPCRAAGPRQRASSFLPDADARPSRRPSTRSSFPWLVALYPIWARLTPDAAAPRGPARAGRTDAVGLHDRGRSSLSLSARASRTPSTSRSRRRAQLGMRMTVTRGSMSLSEKDGGLPPDDVVQDEETILADSERVLKLFHDPKPGAKIRIALAPCSPFSVTKRADGRDRARSPSATIASCTPISARPRTRSASASRCTACARSISSRRPAG